MDDLLAAGFVCALRRAANGQYLAFTWPEQTPVIREALQEAVDYERTAEGRTHLAALDQLAKRMLAADEPKAPLTG